MAKYRRQGVDLSILFLGEGSTCRFSKDQIHSQAAKDKISERYGFARVALKVLGIEKMRFCDFPCGRFDQIAIIDIGKEIESEIERFKPDAVFTHSRKDVNLDHQLTFQATLQAVRPRVGGSVQFLFSYEVNSSSEWRYSECFTPNFFVSLEEQDLNLKMRALREYKTEVGVFPHPRSDEGLRTLARYRGMQCAVEFAEGFELIRGVL